MTLPAHPIAERGPDSARFPDRGRRRQRLVRVGMDLAGWGGTVALGLVALVLPFLAACRSPAPAGPPPRPTPRGANARAESLALLACVNARYPRYYQDLSPWRTSARLLASCFTETLGVPAGRVRVCEDLSASELREVLARAAAELPADVDLVLYLAMHQEPKGTLISGDGTVLAARELGDWLNGVPQLRLLFLDFCFAEVIESEIRFRSEVIRWHAADATRPAFAVPAGSRQRGLVRFFAGVDPAGEGGSVAVLLFARSLAQALADPTRPVAHEAAVFARMQLDAQALRHQTRLTRIPDPVRHASATAPALVLFKPALAACPPEPMSVCSQGRREKSKLDSPIHGLATGPKGRPGG